MPKKWMTKLGAAIIGISGVLIQLPQDVQIGTNRGQPVTIGHITLIIGAVFAILGIGRKIDRLEK